jgi:hypothetical protein
MITNDVAFIEERLVSATIHLSHVARAQVAPAAGIRRAAARAIGRPTLGLSRRGSTRPSDPARWVSQAVVRFESLASSESTTVASTPTKARHCDGVD